MCTFSIERFNLVLASFKLKLKHFSFQLFGYKKLKQWLVLVDFSLKPFILLLVAIFYNSYLHWFFLSFASPVQAFQSLPQLFLIYLHLQPPGNFALLLAMGPPSTLLLRSLVQFVRCSVIPVSHFATHPLRDQL